MRVRFAFYYDPYEEIPASPSYLVEESDINRLPQWSNVDSDQLIASGVPIPMTPTYRTWINMGRPVYRGENEMSKM